MFIAGLNLGDEKTDENQSGQQLERNEILFVGKETSKVIRRYTNSKWVEKYFVTSNLVPGTVALKKSVSWFHFVLQEEYSKAFIYWG